MRILLLILACGTLGRTGAQTIGGSSVFNFLRLSASPLVAGMGGINLSEDRKDIGMAFENPAQLDPAMAGQLATGFNTGLADIQSYMAMAGWRADHIHTRFAGGILYLNYGTIVQTDASGNVLGQVRPRDWVAQISASRSYGSRWNYGASIKWIQSSLGSYRANGVAMDLGLIYRDSVNGWRFALTARNMGTQLKTYAGAGGDDLPFDLQIGATKRLREAPFGFSLTLHHLHRLALGYNDVAFDNQVGWNTASNQKWSLDNLLRHTVLATHVYLGKYVTADLGFNYLRRREWQVGETGNGLAGFSLGVSLRARSFFLHYAHMGYQRGTGLHQFGLTLKLDRLAGWGK